MKQLCLSAVIELPDDLFDSSEIVQSIKVPWYAALQQLKEKGVKFQHSQDVMEVRAKVQRKPRKPRIVAPPQDAAA